MKKIGMFFIVVILLCGSVSAYSFENFIDDMGDAFSDFFSLTGFAILSVASDSAGGSSSSGGEGISIPEPPTVAAEEEVIVKEPTQEESVQDDTITEEPTQEESTRSVGNIQEEVSVSTCSDFLDNNVNYFKKGTCKNQDGKFEDRCSSDGNSVLEYGCSGNKCSGSWYVCPNGCSDGFCLSEKIVEIKPDLKILSVNNHNGKMLVSVKNIGNKGSFFRTKLKVGDDVVQSKVNYYLDSNEIVDVEVNDEYYGVYVIELIVENDLDVENNILSGDLVKEEKEEFFNDRITGGVVTSKEKEKEGIYVLINKIYEFFKGLF